ncbi:type IV secretory system conjugative DNA transfer family protein [Patescibacteria group bacterium]|nr:MAG: type IV secretory system conjugative DNA transfer family protein [Patescibacteria group bacterium]
MFQFGLETDVPPSFVDTSAANDAIAQYGWVAAVGVGILSFAGLVLLLIRRRIRARRGGFDHVVLSVSLPKFRHEEESTRTGTKEQLIEAVAAAETMFSAIGGLKPRHGFFTWLKGNHEEMSFEIVSHEKLIRFYVAAPRHLQAFVEQTFSASYHDAHVEEVEDYNIFAPTGVILGAHLALRRDSVFPIKTYRGQDKDPLSAITNAIAKIPEGSGAAFQFVVRSAPGGWRRAGVRIAKNMQQGMTLEEAIKGKRKGEGSSVAQLSGFASAKEGQEPPREHKLSPQEEQLVKGLEEKASKAGMEANIRLMVSGPDAQSAQSTLSNMLNAFSPFNIYEYGNSFEKRVPRSKTKIVRQFIARAFDEKARIVLNAEEMATLWHMPTPWTETPNIQWLGARAGAVPSNVPTGPQDGGVLEMGYNVYRGVKTPVWIKEADRQRHMYVMGKSGAGKTQLIASLAVQDIKAGRGVAVVDPHGDLIEHLLANIPKERVDDVVHFCPSDTDRPMGLNMLECKDPSQKDMAVQEMIAIFYKLFPPEMIGPMFEHHMRNAMLTLMSDPEQAGSIIEIPRMFSDVDFQNKWRAKITDPVVMSYWVNEVDKTSDFHKSEMLGYLISKVGRFVENEMMRNIIGQQESSFDFREVMDEGKILLVNLSKGKTGDVNAELLGLIIVSKLQMAALARADMPESERRDFYLYIDEFQNFITDSIATILSEARKYRLDLIIAHQYVGQLVKDNDTKIKDAVFGNAGTMMVGRIGPEDVEIFEKIYAPDFSGYDMQNSDKFTWYTKMIVDNASVKPFTMGFTPAPKGNVELAEAIKELSRLKYGRDKRLVEAEILERTSIAAAAPIQSDVGGK